jgi:transposase
MNADAVSDGLKVRKTGAAIPPKASRKPNADVTSRSLLLRESELVERFFNMIKQFRAITTRDQKCAHNFRACMNLLRALAWAKR